MVAACRLEILRKLLRKIERTFLSEAHFLTPFSHNFPPQAALSNFCATAHPSKQNNETKNHHTNETHHHHHPPSARFCGACAGPRLGAPPLGHGRTYPPAPDFPTDRHRNHPQTPQRP